MSTPSTPTRPAANAPLGASTPTPVGDGEPDGSSSPPRGRRERALLLLTLVLIVGASAAFLRAQMLKLEPSPLKRPRVERFFSPRCDCQSKATATLAFSLRRGSRLDAQVIDPDSRVVRTLADGAELSPGRRRLEWDGRDDAGRLVADGVYRWRLVLDGGRDVIVPTPVTLDTEPPRAALVSVSPRVIAPGRARGRSARARGERAARRRGPIEVRYRSSEVARAILLVDGAAGRRTGRRPPGAETLEWGGRLDGDPLPPGTYQLSVRLRDRAGNSGAPTRNVPVRVRPAAER